jgi:hypothetical protein
MVVVTKPSLAHFEAVEPGLGPSHQRVPEIRISGQNPELSPDSGDIFASEGTSRADVPPENSAENGRIISTNRSAELQRAFIVSESQKAGYFDRAIAGCLKGPNWRMFYASHGQTEPIASAITEGEAQCLIGLPVGSLRRQQSPMFLSISSCGRRAESKTRPPNMVAALSLTKIVVVGVCLEPDDYDLFFGLTKELNIRFSLAYNGAEFAATLRNIADGRLNVQPLISGRVGREESRSALILRLCLCLGFRRALCSMG